MFVLSVATVFGNKVVDTYVRIASLSDFAQTTTTIGDWENTKQSIENRRGKRSFKEEGIKSDRQPIEILSEGTGVLKKNGKDDLPCYYFVVNYSQKGSKKKQKTEIVYDVLNV